MEGAENKAPEDPGQDAHRRRGAPEDTPFQKALQFLTEKARDAERGHHRFGTLSHHSFFSRHNPHPHRVTHIQGLNGTPVCTVNDDLWTSTPSPPHPLIKSHMPSAVRRTASRPLLRCRRDGETSHTAESWREELKDLAAQVSLSAAVKREKESHSTERQPGRMTHYSAKTGRIIPPPSRVSSRRSTQVSASRGRPVGQGPSTGPNDQELMVLELLCQVLQTDSLSQVQQWLLYAERQEKDLVMGLIQQALDASVLDSLAKGVTEPQPALTSSRRLCGRNHDIYGFPKDQEIIKEDKPELIGTAEVLRVHSAEAVLGSSNICNE